MERLKLDAIEWTGDNLHEIVEFAGGEVRVPGGSAAPALGAPGTLMVPTMGGIVQASVGDRVVKAGPSLVVIAREVFEL